eukprot:232829-Ditylum_brightwellii.AAC.1
MALCEQKHWDILPGQGSNADLDNVQGKGLSGDRIEFTRSQLMNKFRKWKTSKDLAASENEERFITSNQVMSTVQIMQ